MKGGLYGKERVVRINYMVKVKTHSKRDEAKEQ